MIKKILNEFEQGKNFLYFSILKTMGQGIFFVLPLIIAKLISPTKFGIFSLSQMVVMILISVVLTSSQTPFIVYANKEYLKTKKINNSFTIQLIFFVSSFFLGLIILSLFKKNLITFLGLEKGQFYFLFCFFIALIIKIFFENIFLALNRKKLNAIYSLIIGFFNLFFVFILFYFNILDLHLIFLIYLISSILGSLMFIKFIPFDKIFPLRFNKFLLNKTIKWTYWQAFGLLAVQLINWGDNIILRFFVTLEEIGIYNVAYQFFKGLIGGTFIINLYFLPFISRNLKNKEKIFNYLNNKRIKIFLIGLIGIIFLWFISSFLFNFIYGEVYHESIIIFKILLFGLIFHLYSVFYIPLINSLKKYKFIQLNNISIIILNILLSIILVPLIGIIGSAISTSISYLVLVINYELYYRYFLKKKLI